MTNAEVKIWEKVYENLDQGVWVRDMGLTRDEDLVVKQIPLITHKPVVYVWNTDSEAMKDDGNEISREFIEYIQENEPQNPVVTLSAELEFEASVIKNDGKDKEEKEMIYNEYFEAYEWEGSKLSNFISKCCDHLNLQRYYTAGHEWVSSWLIKKGTTAKEAAGKIHTDFEEKFICVDISKIEDWEQYGGSEDSLRKAKRWSKYGKDYIMQEGDVALFKHNA